MTDEMLHTENLFPSAVCTIHKPEFLAAVGTVANVHLDECTVCSEVHPICQTTNLPGKDLTEFLSYVAQTGWNMLSGGQDSDMSRFDTVITDLWAQQLFKHGQQAEHVHGHGAQLVGFYFLDVPEDSTLPFVADPRPAKRQIALPERNPQAATYGSDKVHFQVRAGDLLFTNAWLPHGFEPNRSDAPFKFVHFIIGVQPATPEPAEVV